MDKDRLLYLLEKDKRGACSADEARELENWYDSGENRPGLTDTLSADALSAMEDQFFARIHANIQMPVQELPVRGRFFSASFRIAASVLLLLAAGIGFYFYQIHAGITTISTAFGETRSLTLPDGSEVTLNGNSELSYDSDWKKASTRQVSLTGEAFFKVVHTTDHRKFRVSTGSDFSLDVLGTQFTVSKRKSGTRIVLNEGKVQCNLGGSRKDTLVMRPGEMVRFAQKPSEYVRERVEASAYSAWKDHKLIFSNTSLKEIITILEDTYGLSTEISDPGLLTREISGSVPTDNVQLLLDGVAEACAITITREGDHLTITDRK